ncbi:ATP-dependent RNA helicase HrpA, partial [Aurantimicrobium sp.]|uniref:ATP-dependent RNA helicase HrpA n=4 Tax=Aurantimicrobium sp. TaxID=1930784 RepID=UPI002FC6861D
PLVEDKMSSDDPDDDEFADEKNKATAQPEHSARDYLDGIISALNELDKEAPGDVLVFLSGETEIRDAQEAIEGHIAAGRMKAGTEVLPLYGRLSAADQHKVFEPSKVAGLRRRIILATNVAETSLTVPGIKYVVDAGTARISRYSPRAKVQRLPIEAISQASANQRSGRCGRTSDGIAIRLYSEEDFERRPEFTDPEILRTNLASVILQAASLGLGDISQFPFLQTPDSRGVKDGLDLLKELGAIQNNTGATKLTKIGVDLSRLPIEPRFARMVLESRNHGVTREVMAIVAGLTVQDPRERPLEKRPQADLSHARFTDPTSDFLSLLNLWNYLEEKQKELSSSAFRRMCKAEFLNYLRVREWNDVYRQLKTLTKPLGLSLGEPKIDPDGIHKSLLSGLLSHIGLKQVSDNKLGDKRGAHNSPRKQQHEFMGARNQKFVIFPGSALAKKPPAAVMSAELVETSRLFARTNAAIDPGWAEKIAGDLCKRSYSEPHWEKNQGAVVAYERVTLFGVTLVAHRRMQYSRVDPELCRELFIRHALVDGEWDSKQAFDRSNRALRRQLEELEERSRRRDILADDEVVFAFYDQRIPADVLSTRSFEGWWKKERATNPDFLTMQRADLLEETEAEHDENEFPSEWVYGDQKLKLKYRFEPGREDDGVTVEVPLPLLARLDPEPFEWLVPGLRLELITGLIKTLPKNIRRQVVPAADWAAKAAATLPETPQGNLLTTVAKALQSLSGAIVTAEDFDPLRLPDHLRMTYRVMGSTGKNMGTDKNLEKLQRGLAAKSRDAVAEVAERVTSPLERDGLTSWDFAELPRTVDAQHGGNTVRAYPALVVTNPGTVRQEVNIRLMATEADQKREHPLGTRALVIAAVPSPAKYVQEHLTAQEKLILTQSPYPNLSALITDAIAASVDSVLFSMREDGMIFQKAEFETLRDRVQGAIMDNIFDAVSQTARILSAARDATKAMASANPMTYLAVLTQEKAHLEQLLQPNFMSNAGLARLPRILIYVRAITMRIQRMLEDAGRDRAATVELDQALNLFEAAGGKIPLAPHSPASQVRVRWMIEEFRVSLFAQSLGTAEPVSLQRIKKALG